jgi:hypothetical protein
MPGRGALVGRFALQLSVLALGSCALEPLSEEETYVGEVSGTDAVVAVATEGDSVVVYVCGGPSTLAEHTRWYSGSVGDPTLASKAGEALELSVDGGRARGAYTVEGTRFEFEAVAPADRYRRLFTVVDSGCRTGVVVDGDEVQGAWCNDLGIFEQVTPIAPIDPTSDSLDVAISSTSEALAGRRLTVFAVEPDAF